MTEGGQNVSNLIGFKLYFSEFHYSWLFHYTYCMFREKKMFFKDFLVFSIFSVFKDVLKSM